MRLASLSVRQHAAIADIDTVEWAFVTGSSPLNASHSYLDFRELVEPGATALWTAWADTRLCGAMHGALTTAKTALLSHPWKLLASTQFLRASGEDLPALSR